MSYIGSRTYRDFIVKKEVQERKYAIRRFIVIIVS